MRISDWSSDVWSSDLTAMYVGTAWTSKVRNSLGSMPILAKSSCRSTILPSACENAFNELFGKPRNTTTPPDRTSVVSGKSGSVSVDLGGRVINKHKHIYINKKIMKIDNIKNNS